MAADSDVRQLFSPQRLLFVPVQCRPYHNAHTAEGSPAGQPESGVTGVGSGLEGSRAMVSIRTKPQDRTRIPDHRDTSFEVDFFCKSCKGHYTVEYRPALGEPLRCRCGASEVMIYSAVKT